MAAQVIAMDGNPLPLSLREAFEANLKQNEDPLRVFVPLDVDDPQPHWTDDYSSKWLCCGYDYCHPLLREVLFWIIYLPICALCIWGLVKLPFIVPLYLICILLLLQLLIFIFTGPNYIFIFLQRLGVTNESLKLKKYMVITSKGIHFLTNTLSKEERLRCRVWGFPVYFDKGQEIVHEFYAWSDLNVYEPSSSSATSFRLETAEDGWKDYPVKSPFKVAEFLLETQIQHGFTDEDLEETFEKLGVSYTGEENIPLVVKDKIAKKFQESKVAAERRLERLKRAANT